MAGETTITVIGNLTGDPELRFTPNTGVAVAKFRIASTPRTMDRQTGKWVDGEPLFLSCTVWRQAAENVTESLSRGSRVVVVGRLRQRSYETTEGEKRTVFDLEVDEVGPSLRFATAKVSKMTRSTGNGNGPDDGWATATPARTTGATRATAEDPFATSGGAVSDDEPPF